MYTTHYHYSVFRSSPNFSSHNKSVPGTESGPRARDHHHLFLPFAAVASLSLSLYKDLRRRRIHCSTVRTYYTGYPFVVLVFSLEPISVQADGQRERERNKGPLCASEARNCSCGTTTTALELSHVGDPSVRVPHTHTVVCTV